MNHVIWCVNCKSGLSLQHTTNIREIWIDGYDALNVVNLSLLMLRVLYIYWTVVMSCVDSSALQFGLAFIFSSVQIIVNLLADWYFFIKF